MAPALAIAGTTAVGIGAFAPALPQTSTRIQWANSNWGQRPADPLDAIATPAALDRDQPLFREGDSADNVFEVTSGKQAISWVCPSTKTTSTPPKP